MAGFRHPPYRSCWRLLWQTAWDGGENACTIAFRKAHEARGRNQFPKLGHGVMLHTTAKLRFRAADTNRSRNLAVGNNWHRAQAAVNLGV